MTGGAETYAAKQGAEIAIDTARSYLGRNNVHSVELHSAAQEPENEIATYFYFKLRFIKKWWGLVNDELILPEYMEFVGISNTVVDWDNKSDEVLEKEIVNPNGKKEIHIDWNRLIDSSDSFTSGNNTSEDNTCYLKIKLLGQELQDYITERRISDNPDHERSYKIDESINKIQKLTQRYTLSNNEMPPSDLRSSVIYQVDSEGITPDTIRYVNKREYNWDPEKDEPDYTNERYMEFEMSSITEEEFKRKLELDSENKKSNFGK